MSSVTPVRTDGMPTSTPMLRYVVVAGRELEGVPAPFDGAAGFERQRGGVGEAVRGRQRHGDDDHTDVHDHATVGPTDEAAEALPAGGERQLAQGRPGGEPAEPERHQRGPAVR